MAAAERLLQDDDFTQAIFDYYDVAWHGCG